MKTLFASNHSIMRYASRTGRSENLASGLFSSIRNGKNITLAEALKKGFNLTRVFKNDTYYVWHDENIDDELLAIVAIDGCIKTVLSKEMYGYINSAKKIRYNNLDRLFIYQYQSKY